MSNIIGSCSCGFGYQIKPTKGKYGEYQFGFTIGDYVEVVAGDFKGWRGHVLSFCGNLVAVDLDEPPLGHAPNGQWFSPSKLIRS